MKHEFSAESIRNTAEAKIKEETLKAAVYSLVPDSMEDFKVFVFVGAYKAAASISIEAKTYVPDGRPAQPSAATLRDLAAAFPPVALMSLKGTFREFIPKSVYDAMPEDVKDRKYSEELEIAPFRVDVDPAESSQSAEVEWYSETPAGLVKIEVKFRLADVSSWLGRSNVSYTRYMGGLRVKENTFHPNTDKLAVLFEPDGTPIAHLASPIRWSSGSQETPGKFTLYWTPIAESPVSLESLIRVMGESNG